MHRPDLQTDLDETLGALDDLVAQGKVRYIGCSTSPSWYLAEAQSVSRLNKTARFINESSPYSIFQRAVERETLPAAQHYRMGFTAWSPMNGGWLTGKYKVDGSIPSGSRADRVQGQWGQHYPILQTRFDMNRDGNRRKLELLPKLERVAQEAGLSLMQMAQAFPLAHAAVTSVILGPRTLEQFQGMEAGFEAVLQSTTLDQIDELVPAGSLIEEADRGYVLPWLAPEVRRYPGKAV
jgi:aryl-alcohol dehydrogenase-like predicted oxidoreductase